MIKAFVEKNFNLVLVLFSVLGLTLPGLEYLPKITSMVLISCAIFFSCSRVTVQELKHVHLGSALLFYCMRFLILPVLMYCVALFIVPDYAMGIFLLALMPVGASASSIAVIMRGNVSLCLSATLLTSALTPFVVPLFIHVFGQGDVNIDVRELLISLGLGIFVPAAVYFLCVCRFEKAKLYVRDNSVFYAALCIGGMVAAATASQRSYIYENLDAVSFAVLVGGAAFIVFYVFAALYAWRMPARDFRSYLICSGANNNGLGAGIAMLYFTPITILFMVATEVFWTLGVVALKYYTDRTHE